LISINAPLAKTIKFACRRPALAKFSQAQKRRTSEILLFNANVLKIQ